jgi:2-polyprenyl-6-methoxyphenol hydroxylase-like FAD-dependent oxidoreductase
MTEPRCDVVIVGARAAGAATAMLLARAGVRVALVDRARRGTDTLSTHALMRAGVLQLHRWRLLDAVVAAGTPPVRTTTFTYADEVVSVEVRPSHGVDALYAPRRTVLDPLLVDAAAAAGADVRFGITVTDLRRDRDGRPDGVAGRTRDGRPVTIPAQLVVGADGIRSTVARLVGASVLRRGTAGTASTYGYWTGLPDRGPATSYEWVFRRDACAGVVPTNDGQSCVFAAATPGRIGRGGAAAIREIVSASAPELADRLAAAAPPDRTWTFTGRAGYRRRACGPGWALVGDAGYFKDPLSAHGITDALRDAELLARAIVAAPEALGGYEQTRDALSHDLFAVMDVIAAQRWGDAEIGGLLKQLSLSMRAEVEHLSRLGPMACADAA